MLYPLSLSLIHLAMICRVCLSNVKKTAVLCSQCSLISHSKCAPNAPPTCDLRAQLLLYAQYAERGNPASAYSNPAGTNTHQNVALSDIAFVEHTSRTSLDGSHPSQPRTVEHPPTAFKFMAAFKRSRTTPPTEPGGVAASPSSAVSKDSDDNKPTRRRQSAPATAHKRPERPLSMTSTSTGPSSLRSAATANESFSSRQNTGRRSQLSGSERSRIVSSSAVLETVPGSRPTTSGEDVDYEDGHDEDDEDTQPPGVFDPGPKRRKKKGSPRNCMVQ